jgi:hypothetical protein
MKQPKIGLRITRGEKHALTAIAPLSNVMWNSGTDHARMSWHVAKLALGAPDRAPLNFAIAGKR